MDMLITYVLLALFLLLAAHLLALPLIKKRPVFIKGTEETLFFMALFAIIASLTHPLIYIVAIAIGLLIYYTKSWIVYGVSLENISTALDKAILATRATSNKTINEYEIDNNMTIKLTNLGMRLCYIQYRSKAYSKKSELTKEIFRKFIQNYFI
ncbi:hypothetical protein A2865_02580 [Candidatus Woesebacteria bacterium RIFCSPHIGHO2_01_FULL_39_17]|uniref:Uncharacterized protein n=3 Tax=Candidatus Woeseibacteriota TaxID=1752722 RepID=A0A0G0NM70_9BACT|nr:MAG: hypothetical protein US72_C0003G0094 [Microgenomates group bacterium GW2011_GWC1_38_12]KKQ94519.1 MAG: hypothetical protein UT19_C0001G0051 [Candidatus Woesebacteria bacterium GW2011_GWB1_39_10b]KKR13916.1 MAG: hypothetical protein UT40_C0008G0040 [Candidatus Woesebacteria bacterium GW2011_GWA1_39_21b]OGM22477.1 MAG: hypothetical protein A2865_02580 [Candidatus Woesebacteria bacterium RIFCSPHIGHO2_01_FULL_39_17]OGM65540.1 MAG: hypothetical protein A3A52_01525 [Candidatus Woesebacteria b